MPLADDIVTRSLAQLFPDPTNPRLPARLADAPPEELIRFLVRHYDVLSLAESIANFKYFPSEPLVVIPRDPDATVDDPDIELVVVEGNRRLAALKGLLDDDIRATLRPPERWDSLATLARQNNVRGDEIPVITATRWREAAPLIGFRHIAGIDKWDPYPKSRFIARLVDTEQMTFEEASPLVGEEVAAVKALYRNYAIVEQARETFDLATSDAEALFGVFTAALNRRALREFIGAPLASQVQAGTAPLPPNKAANLKELLDWVYGTEDEEPVISESRDLRILATVVDSPDALAELRSSRDLALADDVAGGPGRRLGAFLRRAGNALEAAEEHLDDADTGTPAMVERCDSSLARIKLRLAEGEDGAASA